MVDSAIKYYVSVSSALCSDSSHAKPSLEVLWLLMELHLLKEGQLHFS